MDVYIIKGIQSSDLVDVYSDKEKALNECNKLNSKYIRPIYIVRQKTLID